MTTRHKKKVFGQGEGIFGLQYHQEQRIFAGFGRSRREWGECRVFGQDQQQAARQQQRTWTSKKCNYLEKARKVFWTRKK